MEHYMSYYIVCHQKRNNPRMDIRICQKKCNLKDNCKDYMSHNESVILNKVLPLKVDPQLVAAVAPWVKNQRPEMRLWFTPRGGCLYHSFSGILIDYCNLVLQKLALVVLDVFPLIRLANTLILHHSLPKKKGSGTQSSDCRINCYQHAIQLETQFS